MRFYDLHRYGFPVLLLSLNMDVLTYSSSKHSIANDDVDVQPPAFALLYGFAVMRFYEYLSIWAFGLSVFRITEKVRAASRDTLYSGKLKAARR